MHLETFKQILTQVQISFAKKTSLTELAMNLNSEIQQLNWFVILICVY